MTQLLKLPYDLVRPLYERTSLHRAVIEELRDHRLRDAYRVCRGITRDFAKTFYLASRFLPNHKQRSIFAIYGLCRYVDQLVDDAEDLVNGDMLSEDLIRERLDDFRDKLQAAYEGRSMSDPILTAFADTLQIASISLDLPMLLIDGVEMDLVKTRFATFDEVYDYSYKVASVVGLMTSEVFGYEDPSALGHAVDLGIAMQLTNILRDVGEDLERDRIYLAADELAKFGVSEDDLFERRQTEAFDALMMFQIERARGYYESAKQGVPMLDRDSRLPVWLALENYSRILDKIEQNRFDVLNRRAYLSGAEKLRMVPKLLYRIRRHA